jgi:hypothetical protein
VRHSSRVVPLVLAVIVTAWVGAAQAGIPGDGPAGEEVVADPAADPFSVLGPSRVDAAALAAAYRASGHEPRLTVPLEELTQIFMEEGQAYGVRADVAFAQTIVETAWLRFPDYGQVHWTDNNFAGIGAYDGGARGFRYPDARTGVRAQMQLLRQYADPAPLPDAITKTHKRGAAPSWRDMGNGNWATSTTYAEKVVAVYLRLLREAGVGLDAVAAPANLTVPPPAAEAHPGDGLWLAGTDGHVYDVGDARFWGSAGGTLTEVPVVAIAAPPAADGYWLVTSDGSVHAFGNVPALGDAAGGAAGQPIAAAVATPSGLGYWLVGGAGGVFGFGDAPELAVSGGVFPPGGRMVAAARTPSGQGLWLADSAGHVVTLGDAVHLGDLTGVEAAPRDPVAAITPTPAGDGYWLVTGAGAVHPFGEAADHGSPLADALDTLRRGDELPPERLVVAIAATSTGAGYWVVTTDGLVEGYGDAYDFGPTPLLGAPVLAATGRVTAG